VDRVITFAEAFREGLEQALDEDARVVVFGRDVVGHHGGGAEAAAALESLYRRHAERFVAPPISELGLAGLGAGAAMTGTRPLVHVGTGSFVFQGFAAVVNEAAVCHYMSDGHTLAPAVYHMYAGIRGAGGVQHSHSPQALFWHMPGLQVAMPSCPADVKGLLRQGLLRSGSPTLLVNHQKLLDSRGEVPPEPYEIPFGRAAVRRSGTDVTVVAAGVMVGRALEAAAALEAEGVSVEVVDLRTLEPFDADTVLSSVRRTGRLVTADEGPATCGVTAEVLARVAEAAFDALKAAPRRVAIPDAPIPFSPGLEAAVTPTGERVADAVRAVLGRPARHAETRR
jgi:pyruvate/2-oxoglutarate/acetoin dehydrogenase E1 component